MGVPIRQIADNRNGQPLPKRRRRQAGSDDPVEVIDLRSPSPVPDPKAAPPRTAPGWKVASPSPHPSSASKSYYHPLPPKGGPKAYPPSLQIPKQSKAKPVPAPSGTYSAPVTPARRQYTSEAEHDVKPNLLDNEREDSDADADESDVSEQKVNPDDDDLESWSGGELDDVPTQASERDTQHSPRAESPNSQSESDTPTPASDSDGESEASHYISDDNMLSRNVSPIEQDKGKGVKRPTPDRDSGTSSGEHEKAKRRRTKKADSKPPSNGLRMTDAAKLGNPQPPVVPPTQAKLVTPALQASRSQLSPIPATAKEFVVRARRASDASLRQPANGKIQVGTASAVNPATPAAVTPTPTTSTSPTTTTATVAAEGLAAPVGTTLAIPGAYRCAAGKCRLCHVFVHGFHWLHSLPMFRCDDE